MSACAGNVLKKMTESFIRAELLSGRVPDGKLRIGCPFTVPHEWGQPFSTEPLESVPLSYLKGAFSMDIEVKQLSVTFPSPMGAVRVLRDVNLLFHGGKITALLGESGSGKSDRKSVV